MAFSHFGLLWCLDLQKQCMLTPVLLILTQACLPENPRVILRWFCSWYIKRGFSISALMTFWANNSLLWVAMSCSLEGVWQHHGLYPRDPSSSCPPLSHLQSELSPEIAHCSLGKEEDKTAPSKTHLSRYLVLGMHSMCFELFVSRPKLLCICVWKLSISFVFLRMKVIDDHLINFWNIHKK